MEAPATSPKPKKQPKKFADLVVPAGEPPAYGLRRKGGSPGQGTASKASRVTPVVEPLPAPPDPLALTPTPRRRKRRGFGSNPFGGGLI
jgi:hypothetical protein